MKATKETHPRNKRGALALVDLPSQHVALEEQCLGARKIPAVDGQLDSPRYGDRPFGSASRCRTVGHPRLVWEAEAMEHAPDGLEHGG
jgi:hypothetical protein